MNIMRITLESIPRTFKQPIKHLEKIQVKKSLPRCGLELTTFDFESECVTILPSRSSSHQSTLPWWIDECYSHSPKNTSKFRLLWRKNYISFDCNLCNPIGEDYIKVGVYVAHLSRFFEHVFYSFQVSSTFYLYAIFHARFRKATLEGLQKLAAKWCSSNRVAPM